MKAEIQGIVRKLENLRLPPSVRLDRPVVSDDLILRRNLLSEVAQICDEVIAAVASEAAEHSNRISRGDFRSVTRDALHDQSLLSQYDDAIKELEEIAEEKREPAGSVRAREKLSA
jgi:hypothetical protein